MVLPLVAPALPAVDPVAQVVAHETSRPGGTHTVRDGETVYGIAARYGVDPGAIARRNHLAPDDFIHPGQRLALPRATPKAAAAASTSRREGTTHGYTVRSGDTLDGIASRHGMTVARLSSLNGLDQAAFIHPGQRLRVHGAAARPAKRATRTAHPRPTARNTFAGRTYPDATVAAADGNRAVLARRAVPSRLAVRDRITTIARRHGVDPSLARAISYQESGWDHRQVSVANAVGAMQIIPSSGQWASQLAGRELDLLDTDDNITAGVALLGQLTELAESRDEAIAGYYQGLASVRENGMYPDTRAYVANVKALQRRV